MSKKEEQQRPAGMPAGMQVKSIYLIIFSMGQLAGLLSKEVLPILALGEMQIARVLGTTWDRIPFFSVAIVPPTTKEGEDIETSAAYQALEKALMMLPSEDKLPREVADEHLLPDSIFGKRNRKYAHMAYTSDGNLYSLGVKLQTYEELAQGPLT